jgi:hypothetical protein
MTDPKVFTPFLIFSKFPLNISINALHKEMAALTYAKIPLISKMALVAVSIIMFPIPKVATASTTFPTTLPAVTAAICFKDSDIGF